MSVNLMPPQGQGPMDRERRKRRAVIGAMALLEWRDRMARENADRENAERATMMRYYLMIAEMRAELDEPHAASHTPCVMVAAAVHGNGAAGATS